MSSPQSSAGGELLRREWVKSKSDEYKLNPAKCNTTYTFRVFQWNMLADGEWSDIFYVW